jgi:hypothetical protein
MRFNHRRTTIAVAAALAAGSVALAAPTTAKGLFDAYNAHKVDGYHAKQLSKVQYFASNTIFNDFDSCSYTTLMTRTFKAPTKGTIVLAGQINAARDVSAPDEGLLTARVLVDGQPATAPGSTNLENGGVKDFSAITIGGTKVAKGKRKIELQATECGAGMAYITSQSVTVSFSPWGAAVATPPVSRQAIGSKNR